VANKPLTTDEFIHKAVQVHGSRYGYKRAVYTRRRDAVIVTCYEHGDYLQVAGVHLKGGNCPVCARTQINARNTLTEEAFVVRACSVHGSRYSYKGCEYSSMRDTVRIWCKLHGYFDQLACVHVSGHGCPSCASYGFDTTVPALLYYVCVDGSLYKIGVTNNSVIRRFANDINDIRVIKTWEFCTGAEAKKEERRLHNLYGVHKYIGPKVLKTGNTELFIIDVLGIDSNG